MTTKQQYTALFLDDVKVFIQSLPNEVQGKIKGAVTAMEYGDFKQLYIKTLKTPIKELIFKQYRFTFFTHQNLIYFVTVFIKKTSKTPKSEIKYAEKTYKMLVGK